MTRYCASGARSHFAPSSIPHNKCFKNLQNCIKQGSVSALRAPQGQSRFQNTPLPHALRLVSIRYIIVVKLIKSVIAYPTVRKEGLRPFSPPYNENIISKSGQSGYEKRYPMKKRLWPCPVGTDPAGGGFLEIGHSFTQTYIEKYGIIKNTNDINSQ